MKARRNFKHTNDSNHRQMKLPWTPKRTECSKCHTLTSFTRLWIVLLDVTIR